ncbi:cation:proton antiporter [Amycolatopsis sp. 195334CR]|uniref:cation:proton antiporter n=1 Tax=Amycolatopsis sp. 195334CR TaxID=2814588 RepID=UPI001A8ED21E|nr:cation:proton antiporter [Amycolatopsis sp. 195334CR]MBN6038360.1 cation:proton antiporter [Amycolatopsis sp. 195334CR]
MSDLAMVFAALAVLLGLARLFGSLAARLGQPAVVGEIACGLLAGLVFVPSVAVGGVLDAIAQFGLVLFLFCIGVRLGPSLTRRDAKAASLPAFGAAVVPFLLGAVLALWLAPRHAPAGTTAFVVFTAAAMAVTAFPVLARILAERGMLGEAAGHQALSAAALTDVAAWTALAVVAASLNDRAPVWPLVLVVPFVLVLHGLTRPWFERWLARQSRQTTLTVLVALASAGAAATDAIGLHAAFGAFLTGVAVGRSVRQAELSTVVTPLGSALAPLYFVLVGQKVDLGELDLRLLAETAAVIVVAVLGKCGGAYLGARLAGQSPPEAALFAALMNTRGVTELVFLSIGLGFGVIDSAFYTAMVAMALVTTAMTGPLLNRLRQPNEVH